MPLAVREHLLTSNPSDIAQTPAAPPTTAAADHLDATPQERADAIVELTGVLSAVQAELGALLVAADAEGDWVPDGATDMEAWLVARCGLLRRTARTWVATARSLDALPHLRAAFASGALSLDQVAPAARFVTPETDAEMAERLPGWSARQIEVVARRHRPPRDEEAADAHARRSFGWRPDPGRGGFHYRGFLPTDMAAAVNDALTRLADAAGPAPETGLWPPMDTRCADALHALAGGEEVEPSVVVHVDAHELLGRDEGGGSIGELALARATVLRHLCDAAVEHAVVGPHGAAVGIGRRSKVPPRWLRCLVLQRDGCCRFPGCDRPVHQVHHARHWTRDRGPTDSWNLVGLCFTHHRLVHEGGWEVTGNADDELAFVAPDGRRLPSRRQPTRPDTLRRASPPSGAALGLDEPRPPREAGPAPPR